MDDGYLAMILQPEGAKDVPVGEVSVSCEVEGACRMLLIVEGREATGHHSFHVRAGFLFIFSASFARTSTHTGCIECAMLKVASGTAGIL